MDDPVLDFFEDLGIIMDPQEIEDRLAEYGLMIVPIEDPTNLFGIQEDSL